MHLPLLYPSTAQDTTVLMGRPQKSQRSRSYHPLIGIVASEMSAGEWQITGSDTTSIQRLQAFGVDVCLMPIPKEHGVEAAIQTALRCDGLFFTGSLSDVDPGLYGQENCHPATYATEPLLDTYAALLTLAAYETHTPIFGVCGGAQRIAVALGGTLIQHIPGHRADPVAPGNYIHTDLSIDPALLAQCVSGGGSNSPEPYQPSQAEYGCCMHHQAIATLPEGVQAWAMSGDIIEGYGFVGPWFAIGTLFHAEAPPFTGVQAYLFQAFSSACSAFNPTKRAANSPAGRRHALERMLSNVSVQRFLFGVTR